MGVNIQTGRAAGKTAQFETTVHRSGIVLVGKTYVEKFGLKAGDSLDIVLDDEFIKLVPKAADSTAPAVAAVVQKVAVAA
jgi:bifunctional DNA-binding transcriptional regulator/antitoxin component of YhaV-PrlF toxin-antitoxin module